MLIRWKNTSRKPIERYDKQFVPTNFSKERTDRDIVTDILKEIVPKIDFTKPLPERKPKNNKEIVVLNLNDVHIGRYPRELLRGKARLIILYHLP